MHLAPRECPVCGDHLATTRLGCTSCGTEVSGLFTPCGYCGLSDADRDMLRVFLVSRGNMKDLERFLGVSYPTTRQRFADLLHRLSMGEAPTSPAATPGPTTPGPTTPGPTTPEPTTHAPESPERAAVILRRLAAGELDIDEAEALLQEPAGRGA